MYSVLHFQWFRFREPRLLRSLLAPQTNNTTSTISESVQFTAQQAPNTHTIHSICCIRRCSLTSRLNRAQTNPSSDTNSTSGRRQRQLTSLKRIFLNILVTASETWAGRSGTQERIKVFGRLTGSCKPSVSRNFSGAWAARAFSNLLYDLEEVLKQKIKNFKHLFQNIL